MTAQLLLNVVEAALLAAGRPLDLDELLGLFSTMTPVPDRKHLRGALDNLEADLEGRALELKLVAGGYRLQVREEYSKFLGGLFTERPPRYSKALQETLALIAYRQPVTRGEIEEVRGVAVSSNIIRTLLEREWIRVLGHREVPGRPALYGTTRMFLDHFNLKNLEDLPPLAEIRDLDQIEPDLFDIPATSNNKQDQLMTEQSIALPTDVQATDVQATDIQATDVQVPDVQESDVQATDVQATDVQVPES